VKRLSLFRGIYKFAFFASLGFDPFKETQKALAELINDEASQQQQQQLNGGQRSRMPPPPGFNQFNNFGAPSPRQCEFLLFPFNLKFLNVVGCSFSCQQIPIRQQQHAKLITNATTIATE